jgi:ribosomal protein S27AE
MGTRNAPQKCPKCGGRMFLYNDFDGWYEQCLQCSFITYLDVVYDSSVKVGPEKTSEINQSTVPLT